MRRIIVILISVMLTACDAEKTYQSQVEEVFPTVPITRVALFRLDKLGISPAFFEGQWTALVFGNAACGEPCLQRLALVNQIGDDDGQALLVIEDLATHEQMRMLKDRFPRVEISMGVTAASIDNFKTQFEDDALSWDEVRSHVQLINPQAVLSHRLPAGALPAADIDRELARLR